MPESRRNEERSGARPTVTDDDMRAFIADHEWVFAKTMPHIPHWYTLRRKARRDEDFVAFVQEIRFRGVPRQFGSRSFTYLDVDDWTYWTMGAPIEETILINRARLEGPGDPATARTGTARGAGPGT